MLDMEGSLGDALTKMKRKRKRKREAKRKAKNKHKQRQGVAMSLKAMLGLCTISYAKAKLSGGTHGKGIAKHCYCCEVLRCKGIALCRKAERWQSIEWSGNVKALFRKAWRRNARA